MGKSCLFGQERIRNCLGSLVSLIKFATLTKALSERFFETASVGEYSAGADVKRRITWS